MLEFHKMSSKHIAISTRRIQLDVCAVFIRHILRNEQISKLTMLILVAE